MSEPSFQTSQTKMMTVCFLIDESKKRILLGMKKRSFGAGRWNGFGGKVQPGETLEQTTRREFLEECGVELGAIQDRGAILFKAPNRPNFKVHIFVALSHKGEPKETDEMRPQWFDLDKIPFDQMWSSDVFWIKRVLGGSAVNGTITFDEKDQVISQDVVFS